MGYRLSGIVFALVLGEVHLLSGIGILERFFFSRGKRSVNRSSQSSVERKVEVVHVLIQGSLPKGANLFTVAHQVSAEGGIDHYKTVQKRKGTSSSRDLF